MNASLLSWGRYPNIPQIGHTVDWRSQLQGTLDNILNAYGSSLAYGAGRSYGDSGLALSGHVVCTRRLDRIISVDWRTGTITAESGVSLGDIGRLALSHGWFLPVTPGTQYVTLGGAIANDVHGKNHHVRGTFGCHVLRLGMIRERRYLECSPCIDTEIFNATIGGLGLTGVIAWAEVQLIRVKTTTIDAQSVRFGNLHEFFGLANELDVKHEYSVAWVDCLAKGANAGRGVFVVGDHSKYDEALISRRRKISIPFTPPFSLVTSSTVKAFNDFYWRRHPKTLSHHRVDWIPFFYPLDAIIDWNRIYGPKGFQQFQCVIPSESAEAAIAEILNVVSKSGHGSFLAVLKRCGNIPSPGLLSFPIEGTSLAMDFTQGEVLNSLFTKLDNIVHGSGGRLYPAKDAHMTSVDFKTAYPQWEIMDRMRDKNIISQFWKRVTE